MKANLFWLYALVIALSVGVALLDMVYLLPIAIIFPIIIWSALRGNGTDEEEV